MLKSILYILFTYSLATVLCESEVSYSGPRYVEEGSTFVIGCLLSSGYIMRWTKDGKSLKADDDHKKVLTSSKSGVQNSRLTVRNAQANDSGIYQCYPYNTDLFHEINVMFDIDGKSSEVVELNLGGETKLECNMTDSAVNISWVKNSAPIDFKLPNYSKENNTMTISSGTDAEAGTYACFVGKDFSKNITFYVKTRVRIEKFEKSINAVQGDKLTLTCKAYGNPTPEVTWYKDNDAIKEPNATSRMKFQDANNLTNSQLIIDPLEDSDRAVYRCSVANDINEANVTVMVRVKDKLAALWPFLGILAEVAVLCTIIFIYEKRRAKQEYDESDTDPNNESKPSTEQKKEDVRQRK